MRPMLMQTMSPPTIPSFTLPPQLEAREPPEARGLARDAVRLLASSWTTDRIEHARFKDLGHFLRAGDLLVVNTSRTIPAAIDARTISGEAITVHFSTHLPDGRWIVEPREKRVHMGETIVLPGEGCLEFLAPHAGSGRLWVAHLETAGAPLEYLTRWGRPIAYAYMHQPWPIEAYQTVYADEPGSAEMPSAGRAFTGPLIATLVGRGVLFARIILHAGVASLEAHEPLIEEYFRVPPETAALINAVHGVGRRVIAVGTTVVRALESATDSCGTVAPAEGWTTLTITPDRGLRCVDGLLTGFHEPRSTHLAMLAALAGPAHLERVYDEVLVNGYLWHEFGDLHLLLPSFVTE